MGNVKFPGFSTMEFMPVYWDTCTVDGSTINGTVNIINTYVLIVLI